MAEKVTTMRLKVDLQCEKCYKKVKKVLCNFPQIQDQVFDEKQNIVTIKVVCCSPEKIRDKICCKGCGAIKSIEIVKPQKPKPCKPQKPCECEKPPPPTPKPCECEKPPTPTPTPTPTPKPCESPKPCECEKPPPPPPTPTPTPKPCESPKPCECEKPASPARVPIGVCCVSCSEGRPGGPCFEGHGGPSPPARIPIGVCCVSCLEGRPGGLCFAGYGGPPPCYKGYHYGRPVNDSYGGGRPCYCVSRCDQYFNEDNATGCTIM